MSGERMSDEELDFCAKYPTAYATQILAEARRARLAEARWERKEVQRGSHCADMEAERDAARLAEKALAAELAAARSQNGDLLVYSVAESARADKAEAVVRTQAETITKTTERAAADALRLGLEKTAAEARRARAAEETYNEQAASTIKRLMEDLAAARAEVERMEHPMPGAACLHRAHFFSWDTPPRCTVCERDEARNKLRVYDTLAERLNAEIRDAREALDAARAALALIVEKAKSGVDGNRCRLCERWNGHHVGCHVRIAAAAIALTRVKP